MLAGFRVVLAGLLLSPIAAMGQEPQPEEFFRVENPSKQSIKIHLRATHPASPSTDWQKPVEIGPGEKVAIKLAGYEPFDLDIERSDGVHFVSFKVNLCSWMRECARTGKSTYNLVLKPARVIDNKYQFDESHPGWQFKIIGDKANMRIEWSDIQYDTPNKPVRPPKKK